MTADQAKPHRTRATLIGATAVLMWSTLALLTTLTGTVPPFQLTAMAFGVATGLILVVWTARGQSPLGHLRLAPRVWLLGVAGLFGYHFFYFMALRNAPPVDAGLIAYLWPLLIVVFSALLPGERLRWWHLAGALAGLAGTVLLVTGGGRVSFQAQYALGYAMAGACALTWSIYSVLSRRFAHVPTNAVGGFCAATAALAALAHLAFETTVWPADTTAWLAILALGLGPVGASFFTWDHGVKHGDIQTLGAASYAAPLLSTLLLIAFGKGEATPSVVLACGLIVGGAVLASRDMLRRRRS
ncbi:MAG: EamA family transporter [Rhodobacterales bacterium]|nr:EamA family transporter [Rhodobacterales bacterium]